MPMAESPTNSPASMTPSSSGILLSSVKQQPNDEDSSTPDLVSASQTSQPAATATVTAVAVDKNKSEVGLVQEFAPPHP